MSTPMDSLLRRLQKLSELELLESVVVPLFASLGFDRISIVHGPTESGRDLVCWRRTAFGQEEVFAVQVKGFRPSMAAASSRSFLQVL
jgi:hypothetical protein